ncbi:MAG: hypothetical protein VB055_07360 [Oscillospiraceae bacterium]|nr:hypothetical protein [Oscillospiraceae bacterium]
MKNTIYPVIVIYNCRCEDSPSCSALLRLGISPLIVDNSTADYGNEAFCLAHGLVFLPMHGNAGLTKAYNAALDSLRSRDGTVIWLDDDTELNQDYLNTLDGALSAEPETQIFLPLVVSLGDRRKLLSPCIYGKFRMKRADSCDALRGAHISAINSGMAVRLSVYDRYRYDEALFLDYVDHDFMLTAMASGLRYAIMEHATLYQNFSGDTVAGSSQIMSRFSIFKKDYLAFAKKHGLPLVVVSVLLAIRKRKLKALSRQLNCAGR